MDEPSSVFHSVYYKNIESIGWYSQCTIIANIVVVIIITKELKPYTKNGRKDYRSRGAQVKKIHAAKHNWFVELKQKGTEKILWLKNVIDLLLVLVY